MVVVQSLSPLMKNLENLYHHFQELLQFCLAECGLPLCPVYPAEKKVNHKNLSKKF